MQEFRSAIGRLSRYERISAMVLALFGISALFLGFSQIKSRIFYGPQEPATPSSAEFDLSRLEADEIEAILKAEDTDKDGLSDFDEINLYKTSPYLTDSDSDGESDAKEIADGENPNCPKGETCFGFLPSAEADAYAPESSVSESAAGVDVLGLRAALRDAGVSDEILDSVDDAQLLELYNETIAESPTASPGGLVSGSIAGQDSTQTIADVRKILVESGMDPAEVAALSDEEVFQLLQQAVLQSQ